MDPNIMKGEKNEYKFLISDIKSSAVNEIAEKLLVMNSTNWFDFDVNEAVAILSLGTQS